MGASGFGGPAVQHPDVLANRLHQRVGIRLVQAAQDAFPTVGEAAAGVVFAMLEQGVERAAALAVVALDVEELLAERVEVGGGESLRIGHDLVADVDRPGIMGSEGFQGQLVFAKGAAVVAHHDFHRQPILAFAHDLVAIVEDRTLARFERAANDDARSRRPAQQTRQLRPVAGPGIPLQRQLVGGNAGQILALEIDGADRSPRNRALVPL